LFRGFPPRHPLQRIIGSGLRSASRAGVAWPSRAGVMAAKVAPLVVLPSAPPSQFLALGVGCRGVAGGSCRASPPHCPHPPRRARAGNRSALPPLPCPPKKIAPIPRQPCKGRFWLPVQIFRRGFARVTFRPKPRKAASHLYPCNYPCKFRVISGHFRAFQRVSGHDRTDSVLFS